MENFRLRVFRAVARHLNFRIAAEELLLTQSAVAQQIKAIEEATLVARELGSGSRRIVEQALEKAGVEVKKLHLVMTFDSTEGLLSAVEAGLGIAFVSRWAVRNQLALGTLKVARVRGLNLARMFSLATVAGPEPAGIARTFRRFVLERAEELAPRATGAKSICSESRSPRARRRQR
jgi:DNA-binding transcriptional LysR family regulator